MTERKVLRRIIRFGGSNAAVTLPREFVERLNAEYVWLIQENGEQIIIRKATVE